MYQPEKQDARYPNLLTFMWERDDGDWEIVGTLNGETIDDDMTWNALVEHTLAVMQYGSDNTIRIFEREDVVAVLMLATDDPNELGNEVHITFVS